MKKTIITFITSLVITLLISNCTNNKDKVTVEDAPVASLTDGQNLIQSSDCATCHKLEEAATGPSYKQIANKYANEDTVVTKLANTIIHGGKGNWGEAAMMAHITINKQDAEAMVKYILSLKQK